MRDSTAWTTRIVAGIALARLALNVAFHDRYGYFRDELYYLACSDHLAWGYVDHPPLSIAILAVLRRLFGDSLHAIRFPAALAGMLTVVLAAMMARRLGGGRFAQVTAALAAALSPVGLGNAGRYFSMNAFDLLLWAGGAYVLILILKEGREKLWILYGAIAGLGLLNKYSMLFFGFGTLAGLLFTGRRRDLLRPWIWLGGLAAVLIVLPHALWEVRHGFPTLEFMHNASTQKNAPLSAAEFLLEQPMEIGFGQTLLCLLGLGFFLFPPQPDHPGRTRSTALRVFAVMYPVVVTVMIAGNAKAYYLTPIYFPYMAAGACALERLARRPVLGWSKPLVVAVVVVFGFVAMPFTIPVLRVDDFIRYQRALGQTPKAEERSALADLPQYYADMFGWEEMVEKVATLFRSLTPEEQRHTAIYARNYGEAAAIDFFGPRHGLPRASSGHNNYWHWGPPTDDTQVILVFGRSNDVEDALADLRSPGRCGEATLGDATACQHCMPYENGRPILVCRDPQFTLRQIWPGEKHFI
ncbi:MAG TPA: glycosyltransferase family 39 protein [Candidatus Polarisedimenticolia bacterium]|nr:glycosyltransferase family 39 protein [Candidatus Polarisedimenticolia bacterium]